MVNTVYGKYPIIYRVLCIPGGDRRISEPSTEWIVMDIVRENVKASCIQDS